MNEEAVVLTQKREEKKRNFLLHDQEGITQIIKISKLIKKLLTRDGVGKPTEDIDRKFDEKHSEVSQRSKTEATWAQTTQYCPAFFLSLF